MQATPLSSYINDRQYLCVSTVLYFILRHFDNFRPINLIFAGTALEVLILTLNTVHSHILATRYFFF